MSYSSQNEFDRSAGAIEAEKTLRLIAALPAPGGIEERIKANLKSAPRQAAVIGWPLAAGYRGGWIHTSAMRAVAAASIVMVVAGGGWEVYSHIRVAPAPSAQMTPPPIRGHNGLSTAGTMRVPQTLERPVIAAPVIAKQKLSHHSAAAHPKMANTRKSAAPVQVQP